MGLHINRTLFAARLYLKRVIVYFALTGFVAGAALSPNAHGSGELTDLDLKDFQAQYSSFKKSPELVAEIDMIISSFDAHTPTATQIDAYLWKLNVLVDISDTQASTDFAYELYQKFSREDYRSELQYGDAMQQIVQALSKTSNIGLAFEIVQQLRQSAYENPTPYLSFVIDKSLMEIYIETFDYKRALDIELSMLANEDYMSIEIVKAWRPTLLNEIAFLYNRLGDGEKALEYLNLARTAFEQDDLTTSELVKARALNYGNRGRAYLLTGKYASAEIMGWEVLEAGTDLEQFYLIALGHRLIGSAALNTGDYQKALPALKTGIALADAHNITTMKKFLYKDYALCLEKSGDFAGALLWQKKQFTLEVEAQDASASARAALNSAEFNALEAHQEISHLKRENEYQRGLSENDRRVKRALRITVISLLACAAILAGLIYSLRQGQKELIKSKNKAQIANQAKSEFLANMSHEIRTPMNGVLGMAQVLQRTPLTDQQHFYVDTMYKSGKTLLTIINDILDFSKIEADQLTLNCEPCNLEHMLQDVVNLMMPRAREKNLELSLQCDPALPQNFVMDCDRVRQIMSNLVGNAIKFTLKGSIKISVNGQVKNNQALIKICVADTGIGIEADKLNVIFDKFTQAEASTTRNFGGTGLGLAISRKLAEAMNGELYAVSNHGSGSAFTVELPLPVAPCAPELLAPTLAKIEPKPLSPIPPKVAAKPQKSAAPNTDGRFLKILIAEDDEINCTVMRTFLKHPQIHLSVAKNGAQAVDAYKATAFDLIFMDISMPVMDGLTAMKTIRESEHLTGRARTPIICLSAHALAGDKEEFLQAGMDDYLSKPLQKESLVKAMLYWIKTSKAQSAKISNAA